MSHEALLVCYVAGLLFSMVFFSDSAAPRSTWVIAMMLWPLFWTLLILVMLAGFCVGAYEQIKRGRARWD